MKKREFLASVVAGGMGSILSAPVAWGQSGAGDFPSRPIKVVLGFSPGGPTDALLRVICQDVSQIIQQPVVVENRPGAGGVLAANQVVRMPADGYNLAVLVSGVFRTDAFKGDPITELTYVVGLAGYVFGTVVPANSPFKTIADLLAYAKANPGALTYSTAGVATIPHVGMEQIARSAGVQLNHIPYRGSAEALQAVLSGQVMASADATSWAPHVESGALRLLTVWGTRRMPRFPNVPTLMESGLNMSDSSPWGIVGPRGMDPAIVRKLHDAFKRALELPTFKSNLKRLDMDPAYMDSNAYRQWAIERQKMERERAPKTS
jgi:tripartite-type tricarboxylate transporter receptor subunit TctC